MTANNALLLKTKRAAFTVGPAPYTHPRGDEILVRNRAVATNPIDWLLQSVGEIIFPWLSYPIILGSDVAGEVAEVGADVTRFKIGDRVLGHAVGSDKLRNSAAEGGFQDYTILLAHMAAPIPDALSFEQAAVLPLGLSTAACGLFQKDFLALHHPMKQPRPAGRTLLVWGGSTSVGGNAIQLAVAAGYDVIATASPRNFGYVTRLGARQAFDYNSPTVVKDLIAALRGLSIAGAIAVGAGSGAACLDVVGACEGERFVAMATPPTSFDDVPLGRGRIWKLAPAMMRFVVGNASMAIKARSRRIKTRFIFGSSLMTNEVSRVIYEQFLPQALAEGRYAAAPEPMVVGHGLARIPAALELHKKGVSARKVVVTL